MKKLKEFLQTKTGQQLYSFVKTYITVFIGIYLTLNSVVDGVDISTVGGLALSDAAILSASAKGAFVSVLRNIYKLLTE